MRDWRTVSLSVLSASVGFIQTLENTVHIHLLSRETDHMSHGSHQDTVTRKERLFYQVLSPYMISHLEDAEL